MNASKHRNTKFEIRLIQQGPNSFGIICSVRGKVGEEAPPLEVPEELFTDEEMKQVHDTLELLENKFAIVYDQVMSLPQNLVKIAEHARQEADEQRIELERVKQEAAEEKRQLEAEIVRMRANKSF